MTAGNMRKLLKIFNLAHSNFLRLFGPRIVICCLCYSFRSILVNFRHLIHRCWSSTLHTASNTSSFFPTTTWNTHVLGSLPRSPCLASQIMLKGCDALLDIRSPSTIWKRNGFIYSSFRCERNSFPQKMLTTLQWIKTRKPTEEVFGKLIHSISTPFILISLEMVAMCMPLSQALYRAFMVYE